MFKFLSKRKIEIERLHDRIRELKKNKTMMMLENESFIKELEYHIRKHEDLEKEEPYSIDQKRVKELEMLVTKLNFENDDLYKKLKDKETLIKDLQEQNEFLKSDNERLYDSVIYGSSNWANRKEN